MGKYTTHTDDTGSVLGVRKVGNVQSVWEKTKMKRKRKRIMIRESKKEKWRIWDVRKHRYRAPGPLLPGSARLSGVCFSLLLNAVGSLCKVGYTPEPLQCKSWNQLSGSRFENAMVVAASFELFTSLLTQRHRLFYRNTTVKKNIFISITLLKIFIPNITLALF